LAVAADALQGQSGFDERHAAYQRFLDAFVQYRAALVRVPWSIAVRADGQRLLSATDQVIRSARTVVAAPDDFTLLSASILLLTDVTHYSDESAVIKRVLGIN
jgi:hypothetical protein